MRACNAGIAGKEKGSGAVAVYDLATFELVQVIGMPGIVTALDWNAKINQILVGTGDRSSGSTHVLYSPMMSEKGALLCAGKAPRAKNPFDFEPTPVIHTPGSLPMFRDEQFNRKRGRDKDAYVRASRFHPPPPVTCMSLEQHRVLVALLPTTCMASIAGRPIDYFEKNRCAFGCCAKSTVFASWSAARGLLLSGWRSERLVMCCS